jgi:CTP:molybdopterin cytidylyltransferase MocA
VSDGVSAIVLAAGAGRRFGGGKLLARIDGRPILQHVLDALAEVGLENPIVVVGADAAAMDGVIDWRDARRVENPEPARGLSSSLQLGWAAALDATPPPASVLVLLGDQPAVSPDVLRALIAEPLDPAHPIVVARHADGARNPVRLEAVAAALVEAATGDRGVGPLLDTRPDLVREIEVGGANPDIDEPADLTGILAARWRELVRDNAAQVDRFREAPDGADFYAAVHRTFVADPTREDDPVLDVLLELARPDETWLDIGAGAGRYALPLARRVRDVIAVDQSVSMLAALREGMATHDIANIATHQGAWPADADLRAALGPDPVADVALIAHVGYDIEAIGAFLDAMESAARRGCVAVLMERNPASVAAPFWPPVHGEERVPLPALPQFVELLTARGSRPEVVRLATPRRQWADREELVTLLRRQLWTIPGGAADARLLAAVGDLTFVAGDGSLALRDAPALDVGIVTWSPAKSCVGGQRL